MNFDPSMWTDEDLNGLIDLWTEFEKVAEECRLVISKIENASIKNDSFKSEIQASTDKCNEITKNKTSVSITSAKVVVDLLKNTKEVRAQEDAIEKEIAKYRDELVSLRAKKDSIMSEIDKLNSKVQGRSLNEKANIKGKALVNELLNSENMEKSEESLQNLRKIDVNSKDSIISTAKTAVVILKSTYSEAVEQSINLPQIVIDRINNSGLVKDIENMTEELIKSQDELDERMKNYLASIEASNLAKQTEEEIISNENSISMNFIGEDKPELSENVQNLEENKENLTDKSAELKTQDDSNNLNTENDKVIPINPLDISSTNNSAETIPEQNIIPETSAILDTKPQKSNIINFNPQTNTPDLTNTEVPSSNENIQDDKVEKINLNITENEPKQEKPNLGEKVDSKKATIANAKSERTSIIASVFSKKYDKNGIRSNGAGLSVNSELESVQKFLQFNQNKLGVTNENPNEENVSNIFDSQKEEVQPLKLAA